MHAGFLWRLTYEDELTDRSGSQRCCSDRDFFRAMGVDIDAPIKRRRLRKGATKLRSAIPASLSVFRELMRRPAGGTVVVLVPRNEVPSAPEDAIVFDERALRAS